jgi:hypothetical protein
VMLAICSAVAFAVCSGCTGFGCSSFWSEFSAVSKGCGEAGPSGSGKLVYAWAEALFGCESKGIGGGRVGFDASGAAESVGTGTVRFASG